MATYPCSSGHDGGPPSITSSLLSNHTTATSAHAANYPPHSQNPSGFRPPLSWLAEINDQFPLSLLPLGSFSASTPTSQQEPIPTQPFMRKMSEPAMGGALRSKMTQSNSYQEQLARQSLLPMPPQYVEGSHWTLLQLRVLSGLEEELSRRKWFRVEVVKKSLKVDGRWGREKPFVVEHRWEDWLDFREQVVNKFPVTDQILPKLTKTTLFSSITTSKKSVFHSNLKELEHFLAALLSCSRTVLDSKLVHKMFETEEMHKGLHQVEYDVINPGQRSQADEEMDENPFSKACSPPPKSATFNHLELYKFPPLVSEETRLKTPPFTDHPFSMRHQAIPPNISPTHRPSTTDPVPFSGKDHSLRPTLRATLASTMPLVEPRRSPERAATTPKSMQKTPNTASSYWAGHPQADSAPTRPKTPDTTVIRCRPIQAESDSDATVRVSRSVRAHRTRNHPAGDSGSASSGRTGSVPPGRPSYVSRPSLLDATAQPPSANLQKVVRTRRPTENLVTSGANALLGVIDTHDSPCPEWLLSRLRHPGNVPSLVSRVPRFPLEDRNCDSFESDTRTIVPTSPPSLPTHQALVGKLSFNGNARSHTSNGHRKHSEPPFTRTRPSKEDFDPLWKQNVPSNNASEPINVPNRLVKPRPGVRPFKSMQDIRSAAARMNPSDATPMPSGLSASTCSLSPHKIELSKAQPGSARAVGLAVSTAPVHVSDSLCALDRGALKMRPTRQQTHPCLDRGGSTLRAGRHRIRAGSQDIAPRQSPTHRLCSRQSLTSSNSSFGSFSHSSSMPSSASSTSCVPPTDFKQRRSGSTSSSASMTLSDASAHSPLQPVTPGQTQLQANVVIDTNNTSLLEGECGKSTQYVYDPDKGRFIGHHTIPPAPFFPLPPAPDHKQPFAPGVSYVHDGKRHVVQRRPHTAGGASAGGTAASIEPLGCPFALRRSGETTVPSIPAATTLSAISPITTTEEGLAGSVAVKVTHADSGINIAIRVPKSIGLAQLKSQIAHKFVGGAQVHLPEGWELLVSLDQAQSGHLLCSDEELGKLMLNNTALSSRKITLKLV